MDDQAFLDGMKSEDDNTVEFVSAAEHFIRLKQRGEVPVSVPEPEKTAGVVDNLKNPFISIPMGVAAGAGALGTYLSSRPQKDLGGQSKAEDEAGRTVRLHELEGEERAGFLKKLRNRSSELKHGYAKAFREHPAKATALGAAGGALSGYSLAKMLGGGK